MRQNRIIHSSPYGLGFTTDYDWEDVVKKEEFQEAFFLQSVDYFKQMEGIGFNDAAAKVVELQQSNKHLKSLAIEGIGKITARENIMKSDYYSCLKEKLISDGFRVTEMPNTDDEDYTYQSELKQVKDGLEREKAEKIFKAEDISESEAEILDRKDSLKETSRNKLVKFKIKRALPDLSLSPTFIFDVILKDRWKTVNAITNYFLVQNPELAKKVDANKITFNIEQAEKSGIYWSRDQKYYSHLLPIFEGLNIQSLIDRDTPITPDELKQFVNSAKQYRRLLRSLNVKWSKNTQPLIVLKKILALFGFTAFNISRSHKNYQYSISPILLEYHNAIYSAIKQKYSKEIVLRKPDLSNSGGNTAQRHTGYGYKPGVTLLGDNIYPDKTYPRPNPYPIRDTADERESNENQPKNVNVEGKGGPKTEDLKGKKVIYNHPFRGKQEGIVTRIEKRIDDVWIWIKDCCSKKNIPVSKDKVKFV